MTEDRQIQIAFNNPKKRNEVIEMCNFETIEDACDMLVEKSPSVWGVVQIGRPFEWQTLYKWSRKYGLRKVDASGNAITETKVPT